MNSFISIPVAFIFAFLSIIYIVIDLFRNKRKRFKRRVVFYSFLFYLTGVIHVTIGELTFPPQTYQDQLMQLIPFYFIYDFIVVQQNAGNWFLMNTIKLSFYNVLLLLPLGVYVSLLFEVNRLSRAALIVFSTSLLIEVTQLTLSGFGFVWARSFNVDDLLLNTLGGVIGFVVVRAIINKQQQRSQLNEAS
ncbi:VanZ family protein [Halalkalibacterium halodurans]|jgi:glycopeptide antibiotics resistance protein|uniref:VanZ family protein n=1 Tax=Halalkalibacterium halodurans TaxID=86665 RepID=UPI0009F9A85C|nr:VanZ family protein [Halalkalibacterium halodurans]TPE67873.1 VanZ family protein [Halalkalibacterium halodurans]